jgi:hypothetical protein
LRVGRIDRRCETASVGLYRDRPEIKVSGPDAIQIVEKKQP